MSQEAPGVASLATDSPQTLLTPAVGILASILPPCSICGGPLSGRQRKFCGKACSNAFYETARPRILNASAGAPREGTIKAAVLGVLHDRQWHSAHELAVAVKADKHSVVSRISELRKHFAIEEDLPVGNSRRSHRYRLVQRG